MSPELYQQVEPDEVGVSSAYLGNIDALQERYLAEDAYQGSVVLVARHGKVCYFKAFGKADEGVPMATDSIFRLASMSKVVAAACVMQLRARDTQGHGIVGGRVIVIAMLRVVRMRMERG